LNHPYLTAVPDRAATDALPCQTEQPELWFSDDPVDLARAQTLCATCVIRQQCLAGAIGRHEDAGVWGGEIFWHGQVVTARPRRGRPPRRTRTSGLVPRDVAG